MNIKNQIKPEISVIIPVYNAFSGKCYLGRRGFITCLQNINRLMIVILTVWCRVW